MYIFGGEKTSELCWKMSLRTLEIGPIRNYSEFVFSSIETFAKVCV